MAKPTQWEGFTFWPSFTDVMAVTVLIILFVLFASMTINSDALIAAEIVRRQKQITEEVHTALGQDAQYVTVVSDGNLQRFRFSDRILFKLGDADLLPTGKDILGRVGAVFVREAKLFQTLQVEGHTDVRPIHTPRFDSNWELSTARATSVLRFFQDEVHFDPRMLSASGYAEFRPVDNGTTEEAYGRNRRVEIVLVYSTEGLLGRRTVLDEVRHAVTAEDHHEP